MEQVIYMPEKFTVEQKEQIVIESFTINRMRYIIYYSSKRKAEIIESFYSRLWEAENTLSGMMNVKFASKNDTIRSVTESGRGMGRYISIWY